MFWPSARRVLLYGLAFAAPWVLLAFWRSTVIFHLAPLIMAASVPWMMVLDGREHPIMSARILAISSGFGLALANTNLLDATGRVKGPSLIAPNRALRRVTRHGQAGRRDRGRIPAVETVGPPVAAAFRML